MLHTGESGVGVCVCVSLRHFSQLMIHDDVLLLLFTPLYMYPQELVSSALMSKNFLWRIPLFYFYFFLDSGSDYYGMC